MCRVCYDMIRAYRPQKIVLTKVMPNRSFELVAEGCCRLYFSYNKLIMKIYMLKAHYAYSFWLNNEPEALDIDIATSQLYYTIKSLFKDLEQIEREIDRDLTYILPSIIDSKNYESYTSNIDVKQKLD